ncbi:MAG: helix-turn-helix domain-containing protein [Paludibacteraceae bacterium]|jgi:excisionase family DNA binding protein|nr:helix-turn-helix domain-containing protein [Fibrobacter sp.]MCQ2233028.1 helix-turn-helix domain-containing protein [Paludibacteraceae bacterium]MDD6530483.1 helix-turn-helix domain-containing protein [Segatella copri]
MKNELLTFNDLPQVVAQLRDEVMGMKVALLNLQNGTTQQKRENTHRPMSVEEAAEYTRLPLGTMYQKLAEGIIPGTKPGKRWVIYQDELDKWLDANRKNEVPMSADEFNAAVLASHRRKPKNVRV